jgi:hypothetical protein
LRNWKADFEWILEIGHIYELIFFNKASKKKKLPSLMEPQKPNQTSPLSEAEIKKLRKNLELTVEERYFRMTRMMKIHLMLKNAKVVHQKEK